MTVTRRQFVAGPGAAAATVLLPKLKLLAERDLHALAARWCAPPYTNYRYDLTAPYVMAGNCYATDAKAMVRFEDDAADTDGEVKIPKSTTQVWGQFWQPHAKVWRPLPRRFELLGGDDTCWRCLREYVECPACAGLGAWISLPGDQEARCSTCLGDGYVRSPSCPVCHGRRGVKLPTVAVWGDRLIGLEYVELLRQLPDVRWNLCADPECPILWQSDIGLAGIIMPRREP